MNNIGYKFEDAHIRLGSKIHLSDFYYAEKLFVNSYYAQGFAYILFEYIKNNLENWLDNVQSDGGKNIVLLGYGIYSELLLSNLLYLLQNSPKTKAYNFSTTIVADIEGLKINDEHLFEKSKNVILIIPIGTTLTTSLKIRKKLLDKKYNNSKIIGTPITCIVVKPKGKSNLHERDQKDNDRVKIITSKYWGDIDDEIKIITLKDKTKEKYFVSLESDWEEPHICHKCFPIDKGDWDWLTEENILFETDKVSVKPSVIFSLPQSKVTKEENKDINLLHWKHVHFKQHIARGKNHFLHYIDTNAFYEDNKGKIKDWLIRSRSKGTFVNDKPVILLAPEHNTNAKFANDVNEILFGGTATLIHYNPANDYKTNFAVFYQNLLTVKKPEIILIDDAICSGNTLYLLREYIRSIDRNIENGNIEKCKIIKVISMIDRSAVWFGDFGDFEPHSFLKINLPPLKDDKFCYLCKEVETYDDMIKKTFDIGLIKLFLKKKNKIEKKDIDDNSIKNIHQKDNDNENRQKRYLERIKLVNELTKRFDDILKTSNDGSLIQESLENKLAGIFSKLSIEDKINFIKVLAYPHFSLYKNIKIVACKFVLNELKSSLATFDSNLTSAKYNYFSLLIKTAAKLNLNTILRSRVLKKVSEYIESLPCLLDKEIKRIDLEIICKKNELKNIENDKKNPLWAAPKKKMIKEQVEKLNIEKDALKEIKEKVQKEETLHCYAVAVKEVIYNDEAKSFRLECELNNKNVPVPEGKLKDLLLFENITIFQHALMTISNLFQKYKDKRTQIFENNDISKLVYHLEGLLKNDTDLNIYINTDYRFEYFRLMVNAIDNGNYNPECGDTIELDVSKHPTYETFLLVLILKLYLEKQKQEKSNESIQYKMDLMAQIIRDIIMSRSDIKVPSGCFITVKRYSTERLQDMKIEIVGTTSRDFINKEISQETETYRHWKKLFENIPCTYEIHHKKKAGFSSFCTIGITDVVEEKRQDESGIPEFIIKPYGLITLASTNGDIFSPQKLRMLMLLKNDLLEFLKKNYENDSFVEWIEEQNRKNLLLSMGHGFEKYLSNLKELFDKSNPTEDRRKHFDIYHAMLFNRICYSRIFKSLQDNIDTSRILAENRFNLEDFNLKLFFEDEAKSIIKIRVIVETSG